ncbi:MAG TPA: primosomal protein N' [Steroidobacteraceae bacterium]|nr:primosomal protein N' [Steroidobacteraceae bacterium]
MISKEHLAFHNTSAAPHDEVLKVALDVPLRRTFDYLPPLGLGAVAEGQRVRVPFGRHRMIGIVHSRGPSELAHERLKRALERLDEFPVIDPAGLQLLAWAAEYYHHPIGEVIATALPKALRLGASAQSRLRRWVPTVEGIDAWQRGEPKRGAAQRELLRALVEHEGATATVLASLLPRWREPARALLRRGWIAVLEEEEQASSVALHRSRACGPELTAAQRVAVDALSASIGRFAPWVLEGVTGSGKTEVYLRLIGQVLERGQRALVLVPEIGLTPQLITRFQERFAAPLAVLHSALTDTERLQAWRAAFTGRARIVLGTRSAVFAPVPELGLIVIDEEHDASFKQHEGGFRYSARDLAVVRAQRAGVPVVLGSATPALETLHNIQTHRYERLSLPQRALQSEPLRIALVDLRAHAPSAGLSLPVREAIARHLTEQGQVLVFLNRRGYAPTLLCTGCGWIAPCMDCDARLTVHRAAARLRCHHCGADAPLPQRCPQCGFAVKPVGQGTERIEETLAQAFPDTPVVRLDRDVVRRREQMQSAMERIASGAARILIGTQMVTKGHDFPNMTLVVVLNADQGLFSTDFRASERLAQTIIQVAGRAGRGAKRGEVLIQTEFPEHPLLKSLLAEGYEGFARAALAERAQAAWPPFTRLAAVRDSASTPEAALNFLSEARSVASLTPRVRLLGPVPAAMAKRAGRYHAQLLIESTERRALHEFLDSWLPQLEQLPAARRVRWALDVDPIELF